MVVTRVLAEVTPGIWRWTAPHPEWRPAHPWAQEVASFALEAGKDLVLVDPLVPAQDASVWDALDRLVERSGAERLVVLITIHYHVRSTGPVYRRYRDRLDVSVHSHPSVSTQLGPDVPMHAIEVGEALPAGARAFAIGKPRRRETPLYLPFARALAFGDAVVGVDGELRVWEVLDGDRRRQWYEERFLPTLRPLLELDVEHVLVTHGPPAIGDGASRLARGLEAPPWHYRDA
jgi:hypothetical protein